MIAVVEKSRFLWTFLRVAQDPNRLDLVLKLTDGLDPTKHPEGRKMMARPEVRRGLEQGLKVPRIDLKALRALPEGTLGRAVAAFFDAQGFDPAVLFHTPMTAQSDFQRFKQHMERSHDIWHVVTGFGTDVPGELGLQAFGIAQLGSSLGYILLSAGMFHMISDSTLGEPMMEEIVRGWRLGKSAKSLFGADWEALFPLPLADVRAMFGIAAAPAHVWDAPRMAAVN
jgi:ubiquinone biosynthesis protein Coq4